LTFWTTDAILFLTVKQQEQEMKAITLGLINAAVFGTLAFVFCGFIVGVFVTTLFIGLGIKARNA
jgi:hypothetical protein